jgi:hypothetical protein
MERSSDDGGNLCKATEYEHFSIGFNSDRGTSSGIAAKITEVDTLSVMGAGCGKTGMPVFD